MVQVGGHIAILDYHKVAESISNDVIIWILEDSVNGIWSQNKIVLLNARPNSIDCGQIILIPSMLSLLLRGRE